MSDGTVEGYRLSQVEKKVDDLIKKVDALPDRLDERYVRKSDLQRVDDRVNDLEAGERGRAANVSNRTLARYSALVGLACTVIGGVVVFAVTQLVTYLNAVGR